MKPLENAIQQASTAKKATVEKAFTVISKLKTSDISLKSKKENTSSSPHFKPSEISNPFTKILKAVQLLPESAQSFVLTKTFSKIVPYVGTTGIVYEEVSPNKLIVSLNNKKSVQNHIGSVHAVAVTLLAETATGFILGINLPSDRILLVKSYEVNFYRPVKKGQIAAIATLSNEQRQYILDNPKGEMVIPCIIEDRNSDSERAPITVEMTWAWIPKAELKQRREGKAK